MLSLQNNNSEIKPVLAVAETHRLYESMNGDSLLAMQNSNSSVINATAVGLLAIAVIFLAIKEPRCDCESKPQQDEASSVQPPTTQRATGSRGQRELRKF